MSSTVPEPSVPPNVVRLDCPMPGCAWFCEQPDIGILRTTKTSADLVATVNEIDPGLKAAQQGLEAHFFEHEPAEVLAELGRLRAIAPPVYPCTPCLVDAKHAAVLDRPIPEPLAGRIMANGMLLCDIRHTITAQPTSSLIVPAGAPMPNGLRS